MRCSVFVPVVLALCLVPLFAGCAGKTPKSTRMTLQDFEDMGSHMAQSLAKSDAFKERTPASPRWIITIQKVQNLSGDVMTESEQWGVMARLQGTQPIRQLWDERNIRFVIPAERYRDIQRNADLKGFSQAEFARAAATHVMNATFRSATRADATHRTDAYFCQFEITELASGQTVWNDHFDYKRIAGGHVWD